MWWRNKEEELEIKQLRMRKKDMKMKIKARHKELMEHFGYIEKKVPNNLKLGFGIYFMVL